MDILVGGPNPNIPSAIPCTNQVGLQGMGRALRQLRVKDGKLVHKLPGNVQQVVGTSVPKGIPAQFHRHFLHKVPLRKRKMS